MNRIQFITKTAHLFCKNYRGTIQHDLLDNKIQMLIEKSKQRLLHGYLDKGVLWEPVEVWSDCSLSIDNEIYRDPFRKKSTPPRFDISHVQRQFDKECRKKDLHLLETEVEKKLKELEEKHKQLSNALENLNNANTKV